MNNSTYTQDGVTASAMGWALKFADACATINGLAEKTAEIANRLADEQKRCDVLRFALAGLVGAHTVAEAEGMKAVLLKFKHPDQCVMLAGCQALIDTLPKTEPTTSVCVCGGCGMMPGTGPDSDVMNTPCRNCNPWSTNELDQH